jgi:hypothetical protein
MNYRKVIFIDPGTSFGWASFTTGTLPDAKGFGKNPLITSGAVTLPSEPGPRVLGFEKKLNILMPTIRVERKKAGTCISFIDGYFLAWEEAAFSRHHTASRMYGMWEGLLLLFCEMHKIPYMAVNGSTIKAYARKQGFLLTCRSREPAKNKRGWNYVKLKGGTKPIPRPEWLLTSKGKLQEHEIDARWGLECVLNQLNPRPRREEG